MRKNFGPQSWLYPMPVLIVSTYDENGVPNAMNAAWGGIHDTNQLGVCIAPDHKTAKNLLARRAFCVAVGDVRHVAACDYVGLVSGNEEKEKLAKAGFHTQKSQFVDAPVIGELAMTLECKLLSYDETTGCAVGEIVNVSADESVLDSDGKIDPVKLAPITFDSVHHRYLALGEVVGAAFRDGLKLK
ncbi:MAG: flavin reductase family protein [Victivallaceae bacterium]|nr:flavin reductase family protein [Victivallaceae bacterium]